MQLLGTHVPLSGGESTILTYDVTTPGGGYARLQRITGGEQRGAREWIDLNDDDLILMLVQAVEARTEDRDAVDTIKDDLIRTLGRIVEQQRLDRMAGLLELVEGMG